MKYIQMLLATLLCMFFATGPTTTYAFSEQQIVHDTKGEVSASTARKIVAYVNHFSLLYSVDPMDVFRIMKKESTFKPRAKSNHGAVGLMQIIPYWHKAKLMGRDPYDIATNIEVGVRVWAEYLKAGGTKVAGLIKYSGGSREYARTVMNIQPTNKARLQVASVNQIDTPTVNIKRTHSVVYAEAIMKYNSALPSQVYEDVIGVPTMYMKEASINDPGSIIMHSTCLGDSECAPLTKVDYG